MASTPPCAAPLLPSGDQWVIGYGRHELAVTEIGGGIRSYTYEGHDVIDGFGPGEWAHGGRGQVLAPWPNRLDGGSYEFWGQEAQAALDEPELGNAIHGLVRWLAWHVVARAQNVVTVGCTLRPTPGYPFILQLRIEYRLGRKGLSVTTSAQNLGEVPLPFGLGFHPYLTAGTPRIDTTVLSFSATRRLAVDARALPTGETRPVDGTEFDFRTARAIGPTRLDTAFTGLRRDVEGLAWASLEDPSGVRGVGLWVDDRFSHLMVFTGDTLGDVNRRRTAVAIEPMTCPPNAFRSRRDLVVLEPGQRWEGSWGLQPR
jgi:galactose mutarotase-like enzyme